MAFHTEAIIHVAAEWDSIDSIAAAYGFSPDTIWNDDANEALRLARPQRNELKAGDRVVIPARRVKTVAVKTGKLHVFRRVGVPSLVRLQLLRDGVPRANEPYTLDVAGTIRSGETDADGRLREWVPPAARTATLTIGEEAYELRFGGLDPVTELRGAQQRLRNLGYDCGPADGMPNAKTEAALRELQWRCAIPVTGVYDEATRAALAALHGVS